MDKETLLSDVTRLREELVPQMARDKAATLAEGRPWSAAAWLSAEPEAQKYPAGPGFLPKGRQQDVTAWTGVANMDSGDWFRVALGSAALYATGLSSGALVF